VNATRVLIVGAGALGLTTAYHLQLAGAGISFLVRPHRVEELSRPQRLFSYGEHDLKTLEDYQLFTSAGELRGQQFDFVLLTLDGATSRSDQGTAMLTELGRALADTGTSLLIAGVGVGLYEHVEAATGFAEEKLFEGTMKMFAYQVNSENTPLPTTQDLELHNSADVAYLNFADGVGFFVTSRPAQASKAFCQLYDQSGVATCKRIPRSVYAMSSNMFFAFTIASELNGWQGTDALIADRELWRLSCSSQREIMGLKRHGLVGKLASRFVSDDRLEKIMRDSDRNASAMGFTAFNRFHHGNKVLAQDIQILENCAALGEAEGRSMSATKSLLERWRREQP
jgi:2-polyprenyl-6-methoxyphenol hydroxylase-like FAD-dependent oxidoreductase